MKKVNIFLAIFILFGVIVSGYGIVTFYRGQKGILTFRENENITKATQFWVNQNLKTTKEIGGWENWTPREKADYMGKSISQWRGAFDQQQHNYNRVVGLVMIVSGAGVIVAMFLFKMFLLK